MDTACSGRFHGRDPSRLPRREEPWSRVSGENGLDPDQEIVLLQAVPEPSFPMCVSIYFFQIFRRWLLYSVFE